MTVRKFRRKLENQNKDAIVIVNSEEYGFIWQGKVKFMLNHFKPDFFREHITEMIQEQGCILITV